MSEDKLSQAIAAALARMAKTTTEAAGDGPPDDEEQIMSLLGAAVVAEWNNLDRETRRMLFERATAIGGPGGDFSLRQDIATFLHDHHERKAGNSAA